jgi:hypothetical protein
LWGGHSLYSDIDTGKLMAIKQDSGDLYEVNLTKVGNVGQLQSRARYSEGFKWDSASGTIMPAQFVSGQHPILEGYRLDKETGQLVEIN